MSQLPRVFEESFTPDKLIAGNTQIVTRNETLLSGQNLKRGAVVGKITASDKVTLSASAASDGSQNPYGVLLDDYDATAGDLANCGVLVQAEVNERALILGAGHTIASVKAAFRALGIFVKPSNPA